MVFTSAITVTQIAILLELIELIVSFRERKLFARNYDATEEARDPDDWLSTQLRKVRSKRNLDPDLVRRRTQEKMLLEVV